jgi:hypothetical protein
MSHFAAPEGRIFADQLRARKWKQAAGRSKQELADNRLAWVKHGGPEAIEIGLGDTHEVCWLGDGSTLHVVELEECRDHHLVVEWQ